MTFIAKRAAKDRRKLGENADDARSRLIAAAARCVERHGVDKTTMEDIAREAGVSRPSVYRYFADRDGLLVEVLAQRSRSVIGRAHRFIAQQPTFEAKIVEGLLYLADHGTKDPFVRRLVTTDQSDFIDALLGSGNNAARFTSEFWNHILAEAQLTGEMDPELELTEVNHWLLYVALMLIAAMAGERSSIDVHRKMLQTFVVPGLESQAR